MRIVYWIIAACFFTASFDLIFIVDIGGSVRISQVFLGLVCIAALVRVIQDGRILWPRGSTSLALWLFFQCIFLPLSGVMSIGVQFVALLTFTIVGFFAVVQLFGKSSSLNLLMQIYLFSYLFVGCFGLLQFALPLFGGPGILVSQWLLHGRFARINGFSYEPSFFATYMMMGWIMLVELRISRARITSGRFWKWMTVALTLSLFLSSSKTGWVVMAIELMARVIPLGWAGFRSAVRQAAEGNLIASLPKPAWIFNGIIVIAIVAGAAIYFSSKVNPWVLLAGTGLGDTAAHSYVARTDTARATLDAFLEHPFIGRSLGGVPIYIASRNGIEVHSMSQVREFWGFPVILDLLVASGIIGIIPFLLFVYANTFGALRTAKRYWPSENAKWVRALARAMIFECLMLLADQNVLRVYLWLHVSMVAVVAYNLEFGAATEPEAEAIPSHLLPQAIPLA